ncbi:uncharacterized protein LOC110932398 [Helianthus annuus]|uniref:uncharacterized protein LOC110932398 n=1 Tax=Helianthus annuus TaxID=4232 RepID=UPI000B8FB665|nr:uncharacterized protein LOC110932398 [Helianthus annuus]
MSTIVQSGMLANFWGGMGFDYEFVNSNGHSGGLACMWDPKTYVKDMVAKDDNYLHVSGLLTDGSIRLNIINVYTPQHNQDKRNLWVKIVQLMQSGQGWWLVFGDFNAVRNMGERKNSKFDTVCARDFHNFIDEVSLREYNLKGMKYTYMTNRGGKCKMSRIDRMLVCCNVYKKWPNACARALNRELSDHSPLILSLVDTNFGPKPFRCFDSWLDRPGCVEIITSVLTGNNMEGPSDLNLNNKLKMLRNRLKVWYKACKCNEEEEEKRLRKERDEIERLMEQKDLEESKLWVWSECKKSLEEIELFRSRDIRKKSRVKWAALGDENTGFFHSTVNGRKARNAIPGLQVNGEWVSKPTLVKKEVLRFFRAHFKEECCFCPALLCSGINSIMDRDCDFLTATFSKQEIKDAVFLLWFE